MANLIKTGEMDGIIIGHTDSIRLIPVVEKAIDSGIPVIAMVPPININKILTFVGFDNFAAGKSASEWVVKKLGRKDQMVILDGAHNHDNAINRRQGFMAGLKTGNMKVLAIDSANWDKSKGKKIVTTWL